MHTVTHYTYAPDIKVRVVTLDGHRWVMAADLRAVMNYSDNYPVKYFIACIAPFNKIQMSLSEFRNRPAWFISDGGVKELAITKGRLSVWQWYATVVAVKPPKIKKRPSTHAPNPSLLARLFNRVKGALGRAAV